MTVCAKAVRKTYWSRGGRKEDSEEREKEGRRDHEDPERGTARAARDENM